MVTHGFQPPLFPCQHSGVQDEPASLVVFVRPAPSDIGPYIIDPSAVRLSSNYSHPCVTSETYG